MGIFRKFYLFIIIIVKFNVKVPFSCPPSSATLRKRKEILFFLLFSDMEKDREGKDREGKAGRGRGKKNCFLLAQIDGQLLLLLLFFFLWPVPAPQSSPRPQSRNFLIC